jgi:hypothetical protein
MTTRRAECCCGKLSAICVGEPIRVTVCHCLNCKRRTGSAFSLNARYAAQQVSLEGEVKTFTRVGDEGGGATYSLCPDCGTIVQYRMHEEPEVVAVPVGTFADLDFPAPTRSLFHQRRRYPWVEIRAEPLQTFD